MKNRHILSIAFLFFFSLATAFVSRTATADQVARFLSVDEMNKVAKHVVLAQCEGKEVKEYISLKGYPQIETVYSFKIVEVFKTDPSAPLKPGDQQIARMWGAPPSIAKEQHKPYIRSMPEFVKGLQYVIYWGEPSKRTGLMSPIGLSQGVGFLVKEKDGSVKVSNVFKNEGFFKGVVPKLKGMGKSLSPTEMSLGDKKAGAVDLGSYTSILRKLNE